MYGKFYFCQHQKKLMAHVLENISTTIYFIQWLAQNSQIEQVHLAVLFVIFHIVSPIHMFLQKEPGHVLVYFGIFRYVLVCFGVFWRVLAYFGVFWRMFAYFGVSWRILAYFGVFWRIFAYFGIFWHIFTYFGVFWCVLACFGVVSHGPFDLVLP